MIIRINGRVVYPEPVFELPKSIPSIVDRNWRERVLGWMDKIEAIIKGWLLPPGAVLAAAPVGGLAGKLWPLVDKMQEFGLAVGVAMALWGLCRVIMGDPSGKTQIWQAIIGFVGLYVIPEVFLAIKNAFEGGAV